MMVCQPSGKPCNWRVHKKLPYIVSLLQKKLHNVARRKRVGQRRKKRRKKRRRRKRRRRKKKKRSRRMRRRKRRRGVGEKLGASDFYFYF